MNNTLFDIEIRVIGGQVYASRRWPAIPRKGDLIMVRKDEDPNAKLEVKKIVWGTSNAYGENINAPLGVTLVCDWWNPKE